MFGISAFQLILIFIAGFALWIYTIYKTIESDNIKTTNKIIILLLLFFAFPIGIIISWIFLLNKKELKPILEK